MDIFLIIVFAIIIAEFISKLLIPIVFKKLSIGGSELPPTVFQGTMQDILSQLSLLVDQEFIAVVEIPQMTNDVPLITDFEKIQTEIVKNVMFSLSTIFFQKANMMGLKRRYLIEFVTRRTNLKMLQYMRAHNFNVKHMKR